MQLYVPKDVTVFIKRWRNKTLRYEFTDLEHYFDRFFSAYVLYNFLYDLLWERLRKGHTRDKEGATRVIPEFLDYQAIFDDKEIRQHTESLEQALVENHFRIREASWDERQIKDLTSLDSKVWASALLLIVYQIRCNTFHGQKPFDERQKLILKPAALITERLSDMVISRICA